MQDATGDDGLFAPAVKPPKALKFSHAFHVGESGMACADCHGTATSTSLAKGLRAGHDNCTSSHQEQVDGNCGYCHADPQNIPPVPAGRPELIFSHQQHGGLQGVECASCHAGVEKADEKAELKAPAMETCTTCHNDRQAANTCEMCHTNFVALAPPDHKLSGFLREHRTIVRLGGLDVECQTCHSERFSGPLARREARITDPAREMLARAVDRFALTGRGFDRALKVARTIADLGGSDEVGSEHVAEALSYRMEAPEGLARAG